LREAVERVAVERVATERVVAEHVAVEQVAVERLAEKREDIFVVVPTVPGVGEETRRGFENFSLPVRVVTGEVNRYNAFAVSSLALAKSGTVSLELAALKVPHLIAYKFGRWGNWLARRLVKVRFANLINLLADKEIIPEFVLGNCRSELISDCALELLQSPESAERQIIEAGKVMQKLRLPDVLPSDRAAQIVLEVAKQKIEQNHIN
jgi:lipid-A-disaccharide synthase